MTFHLGAPQLILIALWTISLIRSVIQHGKPKKGNESVWTTVIALAIVLPLLYWGGWFR